MPEAATIAHSGITTAVVSGAISSLISWAAWWLFSRQFEKMDAKIAGQHAEIADLRERRLGEFQSRLDDIEDGKISEALCRSMHSALEKRLASGDEKFEEISSDIKLICERTARLDANQQLILRNMKLIPKA